MKPHIIAIPLPLYGHVAPMLQLCSSILTSSSSAFSITLVVTERFHSPFASHALLLRHSPDIRLITMPEGLPDEMMRMDYDVFRSLFRAWGNLRTFFEPLIERFLPVHCILSDVYLGWTQDIANELGVPRVALWTSNASECQVYLSAARLISEGILPFKAPANRSADDIDEFLPKATGSPPLYHRCFPTNDDDGSESRIAVPGLPPLHRAEFPSLLQIEDADDVLFRFYVDEAKRMCEAEMVLVNSFEELEGRVLGEIRGAGVKARAVGPLHLLGGDTEAIGEGKGAEGEGEECVRWLDKQGEGSVVYVAFGSGGIGDEEQVEEMARGLEESKVPFLWAQRFGWSGGGGGGDGDGSPVLRAKLAAFRHRTSPRGLLVPWAPQDRALSHPAVAAFLSHCGWNSTLESLIAGVPLICSPKAADQLLTCKLLVDQWHVGLRFDECHPNGSPTWAAIARSIGLLLVEEAGEGLRRRAIALGEAARRVVQPSGDSHRSLLAFVGSILQRAAAATAITDVETIAEIGHP